MNIKFFFLQFLSANFHDEMTPSIIQIGNLFSFKAYYWFTNNELALNTNKAVIIDFNLDPRAKTADLQII